MKRLIASSLLIILAFTTINPTYAIFERKPKESQNTILDDINYDWWKKNNDSYLEGYISRAIDNNKDIKIARLNIEQAKYNVMNARAGQLPTLTLNAAPFIAKVPGETKTQGQFALPIQASYELDLFGKNANKTKSKKKLLEGTKFQTQASEISIVSMVGSVYYNIVKLDKIIEIQNSLVKERKQIYELMKASNFEGITSTQDVMSAEKAFVLAQNDLIEYKKTRQNALNALAVLIGDSAENTKEYKRISYDKLSSKFNIPISISSDIIVNRPDYKALEKQLESAGLDIRVCRKEFLPTFDILGIMTFLATSSLGGMDWQNVFSLAGAQASLPIFTGFARIANLRLAQNRYKNLVEQYQKTNLVAIQEVNDSLYNFRADRDKLSNNNAAYNLQEKNYNLSSSKFKQGTISKLDLLQQQETLLYMQQMVTSSKVDCYIDKISLYKSTGAKI